MNLWWDQKINVSLWLCWACYEYQAHVGARWRHSPTFSQSFPWMKQSTTMSHILQLHDGWKEISIVASATTAANSYSRSSWTWVGSNQGWVEQLQSSDSSNLQVLDGRNEVFWRCLHPSCGVRIRNWKCIGGSFCCCCLSIFQPSGNHQPRQGDTVICAY